MLTKCHPKSFRLDIDLAAALDASARRTNTSPSTIVEECLFASLAMVERRLLRRRKGVPAAKI